MPETISSCLLCGERCLVRDDYAERMLHLHDVHGVSQCQCCGFRFLNPRPTAMEYQDVYSSGGGELSTFYPIDAQYYGGQELVRLAQYRNKLDLLAKLGCSKGRLLEIGSCTGVFLNEARQRGFDVVGIEPSRRNAEMAKHTHGFELLVGNIEDFSFPQDNFDVVFSSHVFEHLLDPLRETKKIASWIRKGGFLMLEVPNQLANPRVMRRRFFDKCQPMERSFLSIHHPVFFDKRTLKDLVRRAGFDVRVFQSVYHYAETTPRTPKMLISRFLDSIFGGLIVAVLATKS